MIHISIRGHATIVSHFQVQFVLENVRKFTYHDWIYIFLIGNLHTYIVL